MTETRALELGCGKSKPPGSVGLDSNFDATAADVIADLNAPLPFADNTFDRVRAIHVVEHLNDLMKAISEIHRVTRPGGTIEIITPHYTDSVSWRDPTHRWHLNSFSFQYWAGTFHGVRHWYTRVELRQVRLHLELLKLWKWMGFEWLVNHLLWFRRFWEHYLCFVVRGKQMEFTFVAVKPEK